MFYVVNVVLVKERNSGMFVVRSCCIFELQYTPFFSDALQHMVHITLGFAHLVCPDA